MASFSESLAVGRAGEAAISQWMRSRGHSVLPVYEKIIDEGKGPQLFTPSRQLIAPDLLAFKQGKAFWIEAKHKSAFTWHRITSQWVTGVDLRHYEDYCQIDDETPWPVWLLFLHAGGQAKDSPPNSPSGLFGGPLNWLRKSENHRHENWGRSGMVYWAEKSLKKIASLNEVLEAGKSNQLDTDWEF